jgi:hypothetical protein
MTADPGFDVFLCLIFFFFLKENNW